jgi:Protein of unknown function (DUF1553)/Protein of unknown function (DUF1549)/Planctomycete cytochrome C
VDFVKDVRPLLAHHCVSCHGPIKQKAGLRLDAGALILQGSKDGPVLQAHQAAASALINRVTTRDMDERMPPEGAALNEKEIDILRRWIDAGAQVPADEEITDAASHWFFQTPVKTTPPVGAGHEALTHPVDQFLAAEWVKLGLTPQPAADPATLLRRVTLDLTGLPPLPEEVTAFISARNTDPTTAFAQATDRLLTSPSYGVRWGRHFMDIWRYCDEMLDSCGGGEPMIGQYHQWQWRDWIIESLNANKPYDRMVAEMLAGDELAPEDPQTLRATAYITRNYTSLGGRDAWLTDTVEHTTQAFLGTTLKCCRCHDHKYDPLPQTDYYRLRAVFEPIEMRLDAIAGVPNPRDKGIPRIFDSNMGAKTVLYKNGNPQERDETTVITPGVPAMFKAGDLTVEAVAIPKVVANPGLQAFVREDRLRGVQEAITKAQAGIAELEKKPDENATVAEARLAVAKIRLDRSNAELASVNASIAADDKRAAAAPDSAALEKTATVALHRFKELEAETSVAEASEKVVEAKAKPGGEGEVIAAENRLNEVRKKLVELKEAQAKEPADSYKSLWPEYAETSTGRRLAFAKWMTDRKNPATARVLVNHVWMRHFGKPLVDTVYEFGLHGKKPTHPALLDWLAVDFMEHGWDLKHLHRLLITSAAYQRSSVRTPGSTNEKADNENRYLWRMHSQRLQAEQVRDSILHLSGKLDPAAAGPSIDPATSDRNFRRSVYFRHTMERGDKMLQVFDAADPSECYKRQESIVPQQALVLANSRLTFEHARFVAADLTKISADDTAFIHAAFQRLICRAPSATELASSQKYLDTCRATAGTPDDKPLAEEKEPLPAASTEPLQRARESLVQVLFNHTDFVTIR